MRCVRNGVESVENQDFDIESGSFGGDLITGTLGGVSWRVWGLSLLD